MKHVIASCPLLFMDASGLSSLISPLLVHLLLLIPLTVSHILFPKLHFESPIRCFFHLPLSSILQEFYWCIVMMLMLIVPKMLGQVVYMGLTTTSLLNSEKFPVIVPNSLFSSQAKVSASCF
ncbi:uncharacterized protein LOC131255550 isoform X3 [Magnolia sinica]|uniref:uncharacterized protein LOC131255550 isoform X3 n=1 Tax=Magnolia sinica TaxID=86752 RepID=UPI002657CB09|nr:uncharacterized protein LOC131255550 isoform X3 [Magnolia sinica]XP_058112272.1 uncharacterized protein LOC131255550 isoform X3 [Magnolia sinica]